MARPRHGWDEVRHGRFPSDPKGGASAGEDDGIEPDRTVETAVRLFTRMGSPVVAGGLWAYRPILDPGGQVVECPALGVGLGGLLHRTGAATTALSLTLLGGAIFANLLPAGFRQYLPSAALQAVVTVRRTAGLLRPGMAVALLALYALAVLEVGTEWVAHRDA
jgi:hypothetical protein